ncbi:metabotropic glutamate receptor 3 [Onthophagus taurus]|uniref:metabotropic glutamate receptor 3 n=1 Tax=Onthophagus taurus TaxID=166361 RepID=UPI000C20E13C|nr:metabotropic glutamate receptor 3 [Onthophagus taurus]
MEFGDLLDSVSKSDLKDRFGEYFNKSAQNNSTLLDVFALKRRLELSTEYFLIPSKPTTTTTIKTIVTKDSSKKIVENEDFFGQISLFRNEPWVVPLLAIAVVLISFIVCFEFYVLLKVSRNTPSRRHLFLGQVLLLGVFMCGTLGIIIAATPTPLTCAVIRFGTGLAYAIIFASLLVKCIFLISLNSGVYLPATYQSLLLFFAILIQIAIGTQWLLTNPADIQKRTFDVISNHHTMLVTADDVTKSIVIPFCKTQYSDILLSLIYVVFLIIFVGALAMKSRSIRSNYRESTYIGLSIFCSVPIWLVWTLSGFVVLERHRDACLGLGLVVTGAVIFAVMFIPKGRQLVATGKDGVYLEDKEEAFSSISRTGSGYSPSFFHFKPPKYSEKNIHPTISTIQGMYINPEETNTYTNLEQTMSSNPNVFFQSNNGVHPGMIY